MAQQKIIEVLLENISMNPHQPRKTFASEELKELAQSIRSVGLLHPPLVRPIGNEGKYELIAGERRYRAAELAGMNRIPVAVIEKQEAYSAEASLIENLQRVDLNPLEVAKAVKRLSVEYDLQQEELAKRLGKKRSTIANYLRLLTLPRSIQESLSRGEVTMGHAKAILALEGFERQILLHAKIVEEKLSVREAEEAAQKGDQISLNRSNRKSLKERGDCFLQDLEEKLQKKLGTKVTIASNGKRGKVIIDYYSLDDLDRLMECLEPV